MLGFELLILPHRRRQRGRRIGGRNCRGRFAHAENRRYESQTRRSRKTCYFTTNSFLPPMGHRFTPIKKNCYTYRSELYMKKYLPALFLLVFALAARGEVITVATYNIELFHNHFLA